MSHKLLEGFEKATSDNLPEVNIISLGIFIAKDRNFISPEISNVKSIRNGRESYGESAIGYVQVKREGNIHTVVCWVAPEHKVTSRGYKVEIVVDSFKSEIVSCKCYECVAALGGCKHQVALLGWMHRRTEEKTPTEKECYWKKSKLSRVGTTVEFILAKELGLNARERLRKKKQFNINTVPTVKKRKVKRIYKTKSKEFRLRKKSKTSFLKEVLDHMDMKLKTEKVSVIPELAKIFLPVDKFDSLDIHCLSRDFRKENPLSEDIDCFMNFCTSKMTLHLCQEASECTTEQKDSAIWRRLRYVPIPFRILISSIQKSIYICTKHISPYYGIKSALSCSL